jgi:PAS domain S-box-containing protein
MIQVVIVGAGEGGLKLIEALIGYPEVHIEYVVDVNPDAPGMRFAANHGIEVSEGYETFLKSDASLIDVILEVTGDANVYKHLTQLAPAETVVISGLALRFFMLFIEDKVNLIGALQSRQQELQLILNATHDGMMGINQSGIITLYNAAAERLLGVAQIDAMHQRVDDVIPNSRLAQVLTTGAAELNQVQEVNGIEIVTNRVPVFNHQGDIIGAIAIFRDVTELRHLAAEVTNLREIQTLLEAIIQSTQDAISVVDAKGHGILINPAYTRLTGLRPEDVIDKPAEVDIAEGESMHMRVLRTLQPVKKVPLKVGPNRREVLVDVAPIILNNELRGSVGVIHDVSEIKRLTEELDRANHLIRTMQAKYTFDDIIGRSPAMLIAIELAKKAAQTPATVLLRGESGTGKELFAHAIHNASDRKYKPFVRVNCASLSESLLESELFGYEEGAFTGAKRGGKRGLFEEASGGTLFLDEIGEMTVQTQAKLLRALQEKEIVRVGGTKPISIDVRLITATHVNLEQAIANSKFREDLYYRLNVIPIVIPPLRYRTEDIESIANYIIFRQNQSFGRNVEYLTADAVAVLRDYDWPGNVRELENAIGRAMIHMGFNETMLSAIHLPILRKFDEPSFPGHVRDLAISATGKLQDILRSAERAAIEQMLKETNGNKTEAARRLGISVRSLYYKIEQFQQ